MDDLYWQCRECTTMWNSEHARDECERIDREADQTVRTS